jgi:O-antigen ligase
MFKDKPLFGQGLGSYMSNYERFQSKKNRPLAEQGIWYAHNSYLQMLSETGLIGLLSFLLIVAVIFKNILAAFRGLKDEQFFSLLLGFSGGLLGYLVQIFSDSTYYSLANSVLFWFFLGVVSSILIVLKNNKYKTD